MGFCPRVHPRNSRSFLTASIARRGHLNQIENLNLNTVELCCVTAQAKKKKFNIQRKKMTVIFFFFSLCTKSVYINIFEQCLQCL